MLTELFKAKLLNQTTKVTIGEWNCEAEHRAAFARFLKEIPDDFQRLAENGKKRELVKDHLKKFYMAMPKDHEIDTVVERIANLAAILKYGRQGVENKAGQHKFKSDNWKPLGRCVICGHPFSDLNDVSLDHIIPLAFGGSEKVGNWQLTCKLCNLQKMQYWGVADISRVEAIQSLQGKFFGLNETDIMRQLGSNSNPTRYWVFERDERKCSQCPIQSADEKLYVACKESGYLLTVDNLSSFCLDCVKESCLAYCP